MAGDPATPAMQAQKGFHAFAGHDAAAGRFPRSQGQRRSAPHLSLAASPAADRTAARSKHASSPIGKRLLANADHSGGFFGRSGR
jgi:hypothetical protein